jgi:hypothetical protein
MNTAPGALPIMGGPDIYDDILKELQENGDVPEKTFRRYVLLMLVDLGRGRKDVDTIKEQVEILKRNSLLLQMKKHPKITIPAVGAFIILIIFVIAHLGLWTWVADLIGVPIP